MIASIMRTYSRIIDIFWILAYAGMTKGKGVRTVAKSPSKAFSFSLPWHLLARPRIFLKIAEKILPLTFTLTVFLFGLGLYMSLVSSPADYQQGEAVRIMYVHVPASWMALLVYAFLVLMSLFSLVWRHPLAEVLAISAVPIGVVFTFLSIATGSLWGKPMWGTFWVWDARLTSVFILLLLYSAYWILSKTYSQRVASYLALGGGLNLPIIKGSVEWWNTLHQPASVAKLAAPSLHSSMLTPLLVMAAAYFFYFVSVLIIRARAELRRRKIARFYEGSPRVISVSLNAIPAPFDVIPAQAGIQKNAGIKRFFIIKDEWYKKSLYFLKKLFYINILLDSRLRGDDTGRK